jgi:hypothetical protein
MGNFGGRRLLPVIVLLLLVVAVLRHHHTSGPVAPAAPGALAIAVNGNLLIADRSRHEVLERIAGRGFVVAVGSGVAGDGGDGSSALQASIDAPTSMAVAANGALYFAQPAGGGVASSVVREVVPDGVITTVVGAHPYCQAPGASARSIPAQDAQLASPALAIGAGGRLELTGLDCPGSLAGGPLLALVGGRLAEAAHDPAVAGCTPTALAVSPAGMTAIACGGRADTTLLIAPDGAVHALAGVAASALASDPDGAFVAIENEAVVRLSVSGVRTIVAFGPGSAGARELGRAGQSMTPDGVTVDRGGDIYVAATAAPGHGDFTGLVEIGAGGRLRVLWRR